jgi:peptidoglycan/xylan/chitin deacetylase (PgdA/CDA1 family)
VLRAAAKLAFEHLSIWSGGAAVGRRRMRDRTLVLAYHNIIPDDMRNVGDRSLHLPRADFAAQLDSLRATHDVVPLTDLFAARSATGRPRAVITIDDAYTGAVTMGVYELTKRALPATIFVAPAFVGGKSFWWDALADPIEGLPAGLRERALGDCRGVDADVLRWAVSTGVARLADVPPIARVAGEAEILAAAGRPGISLASHSWSHPNLTRLPHGELATELTKPLSWLRERVPAVVPWLGYPYGLFNAEVAAAAARAGYQGAFAVSGGWVPAAIRDRFALPRVNIPAGISVEGFQLRGAGFLCT